MNVSIGDIAMVVGSPKPSANGTTCEVLEFRGIVDGWAHYGPMWNCKLSRPTLTKSRGNPDWKMSLYSLMPDCYLRRISGPPAKEIDEVRELTTE